MRRPSHLAKERRRSSERRFEREIARVARHDQRGEVEVAEFVGEGPGGVVGLGEKGMDALLGRPLIGVDGGPQIAQQVWERRAELGVTGGLPEPARHCHAALQGNQIRDRLLVAVRGEVVHADLAAEVGHGSVDRVLVGRLAPVGLPRQLGRVDAQGARDVGDEARGGGAMPGLDLGQQAVGHVRLAGQLMCGGRTHGSGLGLLLEADHPGTLSGRIADAQRRVVVVMGR